MKPEEELRTLAGKLYWHWENGECDEAVALLHSIQHDARQEALTHAAEIVNSFRGEGDQDLRAIRAQIEFARDIKTKS